MKPRPADFTREGVMKFLQIHILHKIFRVQAPCKAVSGKAAALSKTRAIETDNATTRC